LPSCIAIVGGQLLRFLRFITISVGLTAIFAAIFLMSDERPVIGRKWDGAPISVRGLEAWDEFRKTERVAAPAVTASSSGQSADQTADGAVETTAVVPMRLPTKRDKGRAFEVSAQGAPTARVTFLTPTSFRVYLPGTSTEPAELPEYMRVKSDAEYPPVDVSVEEHEDDVTFVTSAARVEVTPGEGRLTISVRNADRALVERWDIRPDRRTVSLALRPDEHVYGFGDKRAALDQRGNKVEMLNRDAFASENNESYKSIPFYMSSAGYGLFFHNFYPSMFDIGATDARRLQLTASNGSMDFYVFVGAPKELISQYTELTGRPAMLPRWAFGYHQGKASYEGRDAFRVASEMRKRKLPVDVIYYDDWDEDAVEKDFINSLWRQHHVRLTHGFGMPMFGDYRGSDDGDLLRDLAARNFVMVGSNGRPIIGPDEHIEDPSDGKSSVAYLDYFSPRAVKYVFNAKWKDAVDNGAILGMVDFGELDHIRNPDQKYWPSLGMTVAQTRNLYGLVYPMSVIDGVLQLKGGRVTGMVRPGFAGTQRLGWSTTGDSLPTYQNFRAHTRGMLNLTLSGFSNVGQDIGGWDSKGPDVIYARWFAAGSFYPFMWSHGQGDHEPYVHGEAVEKAAREFLNLRYRMVPYFYSLHELAHRTGVPVMRTFPLQEPNEPGASQVDDQFFIGDDLLVAPLFNDQGDRKVTLPKGLWYDFFAETPPVPGGREIERKSVPLDRLPVYVRAGAVIPLGPAMQHTGEKPVDPLSVNVYGFSASDMVDGERTNEFALYEDDGTSNDYQNGKFQRTALRLHQTLEGVRFDVVGTSGDAQFRAVAERAYRFTFRGVLGAVTSVQLDGKDIPQGAPQDRRATWSIDEASGAVLVSVPRTAKRSFAIAFATGAAAPACAGSC
jgi:alpha-glucosidase